jgi:hypothetical protein
MNKESRMKAPIVEGAAALPPVTVGGMVFLGHPLSDWVLVLTAIYTVIVIIKNAPGAWQVVRVGVQKLWQKVRRLKRK